MTRTRPARLRPGARVAVVAPAGPVPAEALDNGVTVLRDWGLEVTVGKHVLDRHPDLPHLAGRDADRAADLQHAWCDPAVDAVICARGGYGSMRMVDLLDWPAMATAGPKVFTGSSDITALHAAIGDQLDVVTLFAPIIAGASFDASAQQYLHATLFEPETVRSLTGPTVATMNHGTATGVVVGGNLSLLSSTVGAAPAPPDGAIVLLEDVNEEPYQVDRMVTQLLRAGWFTGVAGIALGSWTGCGEPSQVYDVLMDLLGGLGIPMVWELGFGHVPAQLTVPLGAEATLDADAGTLTFTEPALR
ncbi:S66 peptidase family protein [Actinophytocola gossypii]|uniref:LD-carboxypeptidase n=1 Tax=Actinophytocola gossypii TaxID=2812003 RepID=A0ABT2J1M0_9PSEU|nr:LD-carboxypeptidase [Actinophytocola gossypii]MCT2581703.1 LD-carboxypeptidase [Actinophytocola gossypii]